MAILDMFDKLDDIIYKPVETVCDWIKAPLNSFEHKRDMKKIQQAADIEARQTAIATNAANMVNKAANISNTYCCHLYIIHLPILS